MEAAGETRYRLPGTALLAGDRRACPACARHNSRRYRRSDRADRHEGPRIRIKDIQAPNPRSIAARTSRSQARRRPRHLYRVFEESWQGAVAARPITLALKAKMRL